MGRERIRRGNERKRDKDTEKRKLKRWQRCEGSSLGSQMYNLMCMCE